MREMTMNTAAASDLVRISPNGTKVRTIPATVQHFAPSTPLRVRLRVAAYARVSTDEEEQLTSYEAQVDYYTRYIQANPDWELVEVYADEGISGTNTKKRKNFNRMIEDALAGKIDRIVTKSVSRFARNTVDTLTTIRKLKDKGVGVFFEKENIDTLDSKGELLITIMSSLAQEESRSISENVTWGWRKRIADGKVTVAYSHFLGYEKGEDGTMQIVEDEAKIVRQIYGMFLDGKTPSGIAARLSRQGIPSPAGKKKWQSSTVKSILTNEKYKGDALLQKTFTVDFLQKKKKANEGEVPQYYVENSHPAIVTEEVFDLVQHELRRRQQKGRHTSAASIFSNRIVCGECGAYYGSKVWHSTDAYRSRIWRCNRKYETKGSPCPSPHLREAELQDAFLKAINQVIQRKGEIIEACSQALRTLNDTSSLEQKAARLQEEQDIVYGKIESLIHENAQVAQDQKEYNRRMEALYARCEELKSRMAKVRSQIMDRAGRSRNIEAYLQKISRTEPLIVFDESVFAGTVDCVIVRKGQGTTEKQLIFRFKDGTEILITIHIRTIPL